MATRLLPRLILIGLLLTSSLAQAGTPSSPDRFVVFYGADAPETAFANYRLAVLDGDRHPSLSGIKTAGTKVFGYISVGEVETKRAYFEQAQRAGVLLASNPDWPDARYVDLRRPAWHAMLLDELIPAILTQGFDGLFLDTLDDAGTLEQASAAEYRGMLDAAAELVRAIHARFPNTPLMLNRAYDVGVRVAPVLHAVLAESLASTYDFRSHRYHLRTSSDLAWGMARVADLRQANPALQIYSLDYWDPADRAGIERLYAQERRAGLIPYVSTIDLQRIIPEPTAGGRQ